MAWGDNLTQRRTVAKFGVLVYHKAHVDVLTKVIRNVKRFGRFTFYENVLEIDLLRPSDYLLQLLSSKLDLTVAKFILSSWLSFELLFNDSVVSLLLTGAHTVKICRSWFVFADRFLNIKRVNVLNEFKFGFSHLKLYAQVKIVLDLL